MAIHYLPVSWKTYHETARKLAAAILDHATPVDQIVAISRGGLTLGHLLTDLLRIPISVITIQSYTDIQASGEAVLTAKLQNSIKHKHILLVDDVSDSGKTLIRAIKYLKRCGPKHIATATMFYKPHSVYRPDYFAKQTTKWILFPYEPTEMILLITKQMQEAGKSKAEIQKFLQKLDYTEDQIGFVRRHYIKNVNKGDHICLPDQKGEKQHGKKLSQDTGWGFLVHGTIFSPSPATEEKPTLTSPKSSQVTVHESVTVTTK